MNFNWKELKENKKTRRYLEEKESGKELYPYLWTIWQFKIQIWSKNQNWAGWKDKGRERNSENNKRRNYWRRKTTYVWSELGRRRFNKQTSCRFCSQKTKKKKDSSKLNKFLKRLCWRSKKEKPIQIDQ